MEKMNLWESKYKKGRKKYENKVENISKNKISIYFSPLAISLLCACKPEKLENIIN